MDSFGCFHQREKAGASSFRALDGDGSVAPISVKAAKVLSFATTLKIAGFLKKKDLIILQ